MKANILSKAANFLGNLFGGETIEISKIETATRANFVRTMSLIKPSGKVYFVIKIFEGDFSIGAALDEKGVQQLISAATQFLEEKSRAPKK